MRFHIIRHKTQRNLILKIDSCSSWNFLDDLSNDRNWFDLSQLGKLHDTDRLERFAISYPYDLYDLIRKKLRRTIQIVTDAKRSLGNPHLAQRYQNMYQQTIGNHQGFDLDQKPKQKEFWRRLNDEVEVETYLVDVLNGTISIKETLTLNDFAPKKISSIG